MCLYLLEKVLCDIEYLRVDLFVTNIQKLLVFGFAHTLFLVCTYEYTLKMKRMIRSLASKAKAFRNVSRR